MAIPQALGEVLERFAAHLAGATPRVERAKSGLSGAEVWRVDAGQPFCLRGWPLEHPSAERLAWMHRVLIRARSAGLAYVPVPMADASGRTFFELNGRRWELTPWLPGQADFLAKPSRQRVENAVIALARIHVATFDPTAQRQLIPGLLERRERFMGLFSGLLSRLGSAIQAEPVSQRQAVALELFERIVPLLPAADRELGERMHTVVVLQPCIRDVHAEHVLFTGDEVTGLIDYGAMRMDSVVGDLVRLLTSLCGNDEEPWEFALAAYSAVRPVLAEERAIIPAWRKSSILLSAVNWLDWLYLERRTFDDMSVVDRRLYELRNLLAALK